MKRVRCRLQMNSSFFSRVRPLSPRRHTAYSPMAGAADRPGEQIPARSSSPGAAQLMTKSPVSATARTPAKLRMDWLNWMEGTDLSALSRTKARPAAVVEVSSPSTGSELGPTIRFP